MNDRFSALEVFVRVARAGSFSAVARETGYSQPSVSRIIHELETRVGVSLLTRTTRAVTLTEAGTEYLARAEAILADLDEADHAARGTGELRGLLRVGMSSSMATRTVLPRLALFTAPHPGLRVQFVLTDERQDLVTESIDVAVRVGPLADSTGAVAKKIGVMQRVLAASPAYLKRAGTPRKPADLESHALIVGLAARAQDAWTFEKSGRTLSIRVEGQLLVNGNDAVIASAVAGLGIASSGHLGFRGELDSGTLVQVLPQWKMGSADINVILPGGRAAKPSARAFAQFMATAFEDVLKNAR
ncbi:DNA-binding transcriptional LysR family regulator [Paraburkholderia sp. GAS199]|uniref:LysR family transcriptional regulator n=1 Tax=Paraburkholderia sp. GAS199 TaxID=3035126 RepID=UPI003D19636C